MAEDFGARVYTSYIAQESGTEPDASKEAPIPVSREAVGIGRRVECPSLFADCPLGNLFEVIGVDDSFETGLLL